MKKFFHRKRKEAMSFHACSSFAEGIKNFPPGPHRKNLELTFKDLQERAGPDNKLLEFVFEGKSPFEIKRYSSKESIEGRLVKSCWIYFEQFKSSTHEIRIKAHDLDNKKSYLCKVVHGTREYINRNRAKAILWNGHAYFYRFYEAEVGKFVELSESEQVLEVSEKPKSREESPVRKRAREDQPDQEAFEEMDKEVVAEMLAKNPSVIQLALKKAVLDLKDIDVAEVFSKEPQSEYTKLLSKTILHLSEQGVEEIALFTDAVRQNIRESIQFRSKVRDELMAYDNEVKRAKQDRINNVLKNSELPPIDENLLKSWSM